MCGFGLGIVFNQNGSTGGTDIIAAIVHKYKDVTLGQMIMACDFLIISSCYIFSKEYEKIANRINKETHRGVTVLDGIGWYSKNHVKVLVVLAYKRQSVQIFRLVKDIDPNAFISQSSVIGVYGEGFDRLKVK